MSRTSRRALTLLMAFLCISVVSLLGRSAFAQTEPRRGPVLPTRTTNTPPPLPFGTTPGATGPNAQRLLNGIPQSPPVGFTSIMHPIQAKNPRPVPKLSQVLKHFKGKRNIASANGSTIVLTGDQNFLYLNDQTLPYNAQVYYLCQNMTPNAYYQYVIFPPNGGAFSPSIFGGIGAGGNILQAQPNGTCTFNGTYNWAQLNLATPVGVGSDPAYPGVWTVAMQRGSCSGGGCSTFTPIAFDTVAYTVVMSTINFNTFSDPAYSIRQIDYQPSQTMYFSASGLTSNHSYAFGMVYTAANNLPCVFTLPGAAQNSNSASCFQGGTSGVPTGILPFGGTVQGSYAIPANASTGTYSVELYDVTTQDLISTQQISIQPSTVSLSLQPFSGTSSTTGPNIADTFATDGIINANGTQATEQSVSGLNVSMNSLTSGHTYSMSLSTPNGAVLTQTALDIQTFGPPQSFTAAGTTATQAFNFPLIPSLFTAIGPTLTSFAPNVMTMQIFDQTAQSVVASKSMRVLAYTASMQWSAPAASAIKAATGGTPETVLVTNTAGTNYGSWDGDGIKQITLAPDTSGFITLALSGASATDSNGQAWSLAAGSGGTIVATPVISSQFLAVGATISLPVSVAVPVPSNCKNSYCTLRTAIVPYHGIAASAFDVATSGLEVYSIDAGTISASSPTYQWVTGSGPGGLGTPRFPQMMYEHGTQGVTTGNYLMNMNIVNCGTLENIMEMKLSMPASFDANTAGQAPTLVSVTVAGTSQTSKWQLYTKSSGGNRGNILQQNEFAIGCTSSNSPNGCGIPYSTNGSCSPQGNYTASVVLSWPIPLITFAAQQIAATADYQGGCAASSCGLTSFAVGPISQLINAVPNSPSNVDSTELAFYSLNGSLMTGIFSPSTVPQGIATTSNFQFTNTPTSADPNPDWIDEIVMTVPTGLTPTAITPPTNWYQNSAVTGGGNTVYTFSVCSGGAPPCGASLPQDPGANEPNSLAPGSTINFGFTWGTGNLPASGTYSMNWQAHGANGGARTTSYAASILFANTTAEVSFSNAGAGDGTPTGIQPDVVSVGQQATIGSDSDPNFGNGFELQVYNDGSQTITSAKITIPATDVLSAKPADAAHDWQVSTAYVYSGSGSSPNCSGTVPAANIIKPIASSGTPGSISLAGCTLAPNATLKIYFASSAPYDQPNHFYRFNGTVSSTLTPNAPTQTLYANSDTLLVVNDARLRIFIPVAGNTISTGAAGGSTTGATCSACVYTSSTSTIDFGTIAGTFNAADIVNAVVNSDAQGSHGWQLYVELATAPPAGGTFTTDVDAAAAYQYSGPYYTNNQSALITPSTTAPGTLLSSFAGATATSTYTHTPVPNYMNVQVALPAFPTALTPGANSVTLTYTLVPN